ncbi:unnamed protein product [Rhizophagus irregularis]|nr:unnamed protein product [Rhizophagus irregularis]
MGASKLHYFENLFSDFYLKKLMFLLYPFVCFGLLSELGGDYTGNARIIQNTFGDTGTVSFSTFRWFRAWDTGIFWYDSIQYKLQTMTIYWSIEQDNKGQVHNNAYCAIFGRNTFRLNISIFKIITQTFSPANTAPPSNQDAS